MITHIKDRVEIRKHIKDYFPESKGKIKRKDGYLLLRYENSKASLMVVFNPYKASKDRLSSAIFRTKK